MEIRTARMMDKKELYELLCYQEDRAIDQELFDKMLFGNINTPSIYYIVATIDEDVVGFGSLHVQTLLHHLGYVAEIQELVVNKAFQHQGIGTQLFQALKQRAIDLECKELEVCFRKEHHFAEVFYRQCKMDMSHQKGTLSLQ